MKRNFLLPLLAACTFFATSCTQELDVPQPDQVVETNVAITRAESFYNPATGTWVRPQADPYAFDNFRAAAERLSVAAPEPTHTVIKFLPQTEAELKTIEVAEGINLSYTPFDYASVPVTVSKDWAVEGARIVEFETSRYDGFPVLYAVWPRGTALPAGVEYEELYEVYLPTAGDEMGAVKEEAIRMALGDRYKERSLTRAADDEYLFRFTHTDDIMAGEMPLHGIRVKVGLGSSAVYGYTDAQGVVTFGSTAIDGNDDATLIFESNYWKIVGTAGVAPIELPLGAAMWVSVYCMNGFSVSIDEYLPGPVCEALQAVSYHFLGAHGFYNNQDRVLNNNVSNSSRVEITVHTTSVLSPDMITVDTDVYAPAIDLYRVNMYDTGHMLGVIWNRLGKIIHSGIMDKTTTGLPKPIPVYPDIQPWIKESFGSYTAWWYGEKYYQMRGLITHPYAYNDITGQASQEWDCYDYNDINTPIFIDLVDNVNQMAHTASPVYDEFVTNLNPVTPIGNIPLHQAIILDELDLTYSWTRLRWVLLERVVIPLVPYGADLVEDYLEYYDNWAPNVE